MKGEPLTAAESDLRESVTETILTSPDASRDEVTPHLLRIFILLKNESKAERLARSRSAFTNVKKEKDEWKVRGDSMA